MACWSKANISLYRSASLHQLLFFSLVIKCNPCGRPWRNRFYRGFEHVMTRAVPQQNRTVADLGTKREEEIGVMAYVYVYTRWKPRLILLPILCPRQRFRLRISIEMRRAHASGSLSLSLSFFFPLLLSRSFAFEMQYQSYLNFKRVIFTNEKMCRLNFVYLPKRLCDKQVFIV